MNKEKEKCEHKWVMEEHTFEIWWICSRCGEKEIWLNCKNYMVK